jgi:hypothetical protein
MGERETFGRWEAIRIDRCSSTLACDGSATARSAHGISWCEGKLALVLARLGLMSSADGSIVGIGAKIDGKFGVTIGAAFNARWAMREKKSAIAHSLEIELPPRVAHCQNIGFAPAICPR